MTGTPNFASKDCMCATGKGADAVRTKRNVPGKNAGRSVLSSIATIVGTMLAHVMSYASIHDQKRLRLKRRAITTVLPASNDEQRLTTGALTWENGRTVRPRSLEVRRCEVRI